MASNEETQELEILSLKSIYPDLFFENVSSNAWKVRIDPLLVIS